MVLVLHGAKLLGGCCTEALSLVAQGPCKEIGPGALHEPALQPSCLDCASRGALRPGFARCGEKIATAIGRRGHWLERLRGATEELFVVKKVHVNVGTIGHIDHG